MSRREQLREAYEQMRELSPKSKRTAPEMAVPVLPRLSRKPPKRFQKLLDQFNKSAGEKLFAYWNTRSVPRVSGTVNADGQYTVSGWEGRWELWRPVNERMPFEAFVVIQPLVIQGIGPAVRLWRIQDDCKDVRLMHPSGAEQIFQVGTARQPDERDIKTLRLCDLYRDSPGKVMRELVDEPNAKMEEDAEKELDDLSAALTSFYWSKAGGIYALGQPEGMQKDTPLILGE